MRIALIAGASGLVGGELLRALLAAPEYDRVIALGRQSLDCEHPKLRSVQVNFAALDQVVGELGCTGGFSRGRSNGGFGLCLVSAASWGREFFGDLVLRGARAVTGVLFAG